MQAKEWFEKYPARAQKLVAKRKEGVTWKQLERDFDLPDNSGMAAWRIYCWAEDVKRPPSARVKNTKTVAFTLDVAAQGRLEAAKHHYKTSASHALRRVLEDWAERHGK